MGSTAEGAGPIRSPRRRLGDDAALSRGSSSLGRVLGQVPGKAKGIQYLEMVLWMDQIYVAPPKKQWLEAWFVTVFTGKPSFPKFLRWCETDFVHHGSFGLVSTGLVSACKEPQVLGDRERALSARKSRLRELRLVHRCVHHLQDFSATRGPGIGPQTLSPYLHLPGFHVEVTPFFDSHMYCVSSTPVISPMRIRAHDGIRCF